MAHMIDTTTGTAAIAYIGTTPWHGLGQRIAPGSAMDEWMKAAALQWDAITAPIFFNLPEQAGQQPGQKTVDGKVAIFRSDTFAPLGIVSTEYKIVQPSDIMETFKAIVEKGHGEMETLGAIKEGRVIWGLARIGENAMVMDDQVAPYLMLSTSFDGSMATTAQFTAVRIVCNNTLQRALNNGQGQHRVTIPHSAIFDQSKLRADLGLKVDSWERFIGNANLMAKRKVTESEADAYLKELLAPYAPSGVDVTPKTIERTKAYKQVLELFHGGQKGAGQDAVNDSVWGLLNATTEYIDHHKGFSQDRRLDAAWFGVGAQIKNHAHELAMKLAA